MILSSFLFLFISTSSASPADYTVAFGTNSNKFDRLRAFRILATQILWIIQRITMCPHGYHHNGFMVTPALGTQEVRFWIIFEITLKVLYFRKFTQKWSGCISDSYCSLKSLWSGLGEEVPAHTLPTLHRPSPHTVLYLSCLKVSQCINCRD